MEPNFICIENVLSFHELQLEEHGGTAGIRDLGLLDSAIMMPQASFGGEFVHQDIYEMAAAYLFHICKNHRFVDGN